MVCPSDGGFVTATIRDTTNNSQVTKQTCLVYPTQPVKLLLKEITQKFGYEPESVEVSVQCAATDEVILNDHIDKTLAEAGVNFTGRILIVILEQKSKSMQVYIQGGSSSEDDLLLGASASPTSGEVPSNSSLEPPPAIISSEDYFMKLSQPSHSSIDSNAIVPYCNYVGLVNQAMTCYLNSLLQALYMTPEFRNALYNWEFDGNYQTNGIPFQLQKLFLNLQTSQRSAVETTELTQSFGWNVQEAWEQHDIQELCRVMFDALEKTFINTKQANLINDLYEGKMLDYVKCLDCSTEKSREDTFQDIPLPVKPFGSNVAYNSVEEALRAFVQPETLDGTNQYFCEKCNKKCDAHKGLKFTKFPYLLTLHLKRFDFDYSTMNRIKLNDKVVFPEELNLNSFIPTHNTLMDEVMEERDVTVKCDDCSTTDSGSALDDESCQGTDISSVVNGHDDNQDDDEGIDVSSGNNLENEKNRLHELKGPYIYELFSIMIHSGSASGGHYYAYIKDFSKNEWYCFNDQSVTVVTQSDIEKSYGGGPARGYYSGAYTSSTNAYMLMYRQIDRERNCLPLTTEFFPPHIKKLLQDMRDKEDNDRREKQREDDLVKIKIFFRDPNLTDITDGKMYIFQNMTLQEATEKTYDHFKLTNRVNLGDCRLVAFDKAGDFIECSFDPDCNFWEVARKHNGFLMEVKNSDNEFTEYKMGGAYMKVYYISLESENVEGPSSLWINPNTTVLDLKNRIQSMYDIENVYIVQENVHPLSPSERYYLDDDKAILKMDSKSNEYKLYVSNLFDLENSNKPYEESKLASIIDRFVHVIMIDISFPETDLATLDKLSIPSFDLNQNLDKIDVGMVDKTSNSSSLRVSPQPGIGSSEIFGDLSNSEDSSLSDSDRTLIGDAPGDNIGILSNSNSPGDQHMSSPTEAGFSDYPEYSLSKSPEEMHCDEDDYLQGIGDTNHYFKANILLDEKEQRCCRVIVDKRMTFGVLKKNLEPYLGVPAEYFKIYRLNNPKKIFWSSMSESLSSIKDNSRLFVKLGRVCRNNEFAAEVYYLQPDKIEPFTYWFEWILPKEQTVASAKREILFQAKKQHMIDIPYNRCRLRRKQYRKPAKVYLDHEKFSEYHNITNDFELFVQEISGAEKANESDCVAFVRQWHPSTLTLDIYQEIILESESKSVEDIITKISILSKIPVEFVEFGVVKSSFTCDMNVLEIQTKVPWNPEQVDVYDDTSMFYYRDSRENVKELTSEERKEINQKENKRLGRTNPGRSYSHRKENSLKIHLDMPPKKQDD